MPSFLKYRSWANLCYDKPQLRFLFTLRGDSDALASMILIISIWSLEKCLEIKVMHQDYSYHYGQPKVHGRERMHFSSDSILRLGTFPITV